MTEELDIAAQCIRSLCRLYNLSSVLQRRSFGWQVFHDLGLIALRFSLFVGCIRSRHTCMKRSIDLTSWMINSSPVFTSLWSGRHSGPIHSSSYCLMLSSCLWVWLMHEQFPKAYIFHKNKKWSCNATNTHTSLISKFPSHSAFNYCCNQVAYSTTMCPAATSLPCKSS